MELYLADWEPHNLSRADRNRIVVIILIAFQADFNLSVPVEKVVLWRIKEEQGKQTF